MKTIGMLGGMSWQSTVPYYQIANQTVAEALGGLHSAKILLHSVEFAELEANMAAGRWDENAAILTAAAKGLEGAGADFILICTNTMHKLAPQIEADIGIPLLHIADATADELRAAGISRAALLGTRTTMQGDFYRGKLAARGIEVLLPTPEEMDALHRMIFEELCAGTFTGAGRAFLVGVIERLAAEGAQGAILGCTELGLLVTEQDTGVPLFDTAVIHARRAAWMALEG